MSTQNPFQFHNARRKFHADLLAGPLQVSQNEVPANADKDSRISVAIARNIAIAIGSTTRGIRLAGQTSGVKFEGNCADFLATTFPQLAHLRPGKWDIHVVGGRSGIEIANYEQYAHLAALQALSAGNPELAAALGNDYAITPDIVIVRGTEDDSVINQPQALVDEHIARHASLRSINNGLNLLHASISCKWTLRSDRAQNARSEALNFIRNRKGQLPHIAVVTAEPTPARIASLALGTGDIDCVYHFALPELVDALNVLDYPDAKELLNIMIIGKRLKDIADLPLDLAV